MGTPVHRDAVDELDYAGERTPANAEENDMKTNELQTILGYSRFSSAIFVNVPLS